jgi:putative ubiquitin-RnfH superfamily antitoxin RatB of RatAB toxin-antitoxin module
MKITVIYSCAARQIREWALDLESGSTALQAIETTGVLDEFPDLRLQPLLLGIWGKRAGMNKLLRDNDRVEIYRSLRVDPKVARRERFNRQGAKAAGLFAAVRPGAKAGY